MDLRDWQLICFTEGGQFFIDISLLFVIKWAAYTCQETTNIVAQHLNSQGATTLSYIDDFRRLHT